MESSAVASRHALAAPGAYRRMSSALASDRRKAARGAVVVPRAAAPGRQDAARKKIAVVTGGAKGIGAACCRLLARDGWAVAVNHRTGSKDAADGVVASIVDAGGVAAAFPADVGVEEDVVAMFAAIDDWALAVDGVVAGLVNNAGVLNGPNGCKSVEHASLEDLNAIFAVNVAGPMLCTREALRRMSTKISPGGAGAGGAVVNVSSGSAVIGRPLLYAMSKGALNSFQAGAVDELAAHGVRVNAVSPGMTDTSLIDDIRDSFDLAKIPLGRFGTPEETAECVCFLLGDAASYVSGANVRVGGGRPPGTFLG